MLRPSIVGAGTTMLNLTILNARTSRPWARA